MNCPRDDTAPPAAQKAGATRTTEDANESTCARRRRRKNGTIAGNMARDRSAVVLGASGSVGEALIEALILHDAIATVVTLVRRSQPAYAALAAERGVTLREVIVAAMEPAALEARDARRGDGARRSGRRAERPRRGRQHRCADDRSAPRGGRRAQRGVRQGSRAIGARRAPGVHVGERRRRDGLDDGLWRRGGWPATTA
jgi:hypothetical protein